MCEVFLPALLAREGTNKHQSPMEENLLCNNIH